MKLTLSSTIVVRSPRFNFFVKILSNVGQRGAEWLVTELWAEVWVFVQHLCRREIDLCRREIVDESPNTRDSNSLASGQRADQLVILHHFQTS
jgi:hypothetical protein